MQLEESPYAWGTAIGLPRVLLCVSSMWGCLVRRRLVPSCDAPTGPQAQASSSDTGSEVFTISSMGPGEWNLIMHYRLWTPCTTYPTNPGCNADNATIRVDFAKGLRVTVLGASASLPAPALAPFAPCHKTRAPPIAPSRTMELTHVLPADGPHRENRHRMRLGLPADRGQVRGVPRGHLRVPDPGVRSRPRAALHPNPSPNPRPDPDPNPSLNPNPILTLTL